MKKGVRARGVMRGLEASAHSLTIAWFPGLITVVMLIALQKPTTKPRSLGTSIPQPYPGQGRESPILPPPPPSMRVDNLLFPTIKAPMPSSD